MGRDTGIANRLRNAGLRVIEVDGWQSRGSDDFDPDGSVNHHTAGPSSGETPSLNTCINGRPDLAGPLCNVFQSRDDQGLDIAYVVAAGRANHAGEGSWKGLSGNRKVYGLEIEHTGTSSVPSGRLDIAAKIHSAMFTGDPAYVCQHKEWAPSRKIDFATNATGEDFRNKVRNARKPPAPTNPNKGFDVFAVQHTGGAIYLCGPGLWHHMTPTQWTAIAPHIAPLVGPKLNDSERDQLQDIMLDIGLKNPVRAVLNEGTGQGQSSWAGTEKAILSTVQGHTNALNAQSDALQKLAELAGLDLTIDLLDFLNDGEPNIPPALPG